MKPQKAKELMTDNGNLYGTYPGQWWQTSESGKSWRLWERDEKGLIHLVHTLRRKQVIAVTKPFDVWP